MTFLALTILDSGVWLAMLCALAGLGFAYFLIQSVIKASPGNARMQEIAGAIQEGAKAYLNRQVMTISAIAVVIFILLFIWKDHATAVGFVVGAVCSLAAGFIGMRIAVLANTRTTQVFINFADNTNLDGMGFAPFGRIVSGMNVVDAINAEYGEGAPRGRGPDQGKLQNEGNAYLAREFARMDYIKKATIEK